MKTPKYLWPPCWSIGGDTNVSAQTSYGIKIGGVSVTSNNYTHISASNGFSTISNGTVTYDPNTWWSSMPTMR